MYQADNIPDKLGSSYKVMIRQKMQINPTIKDLEYPFCNRPQMRQSVQWKGKCREEHHEG